MFLKFIDNTKKENLPSPRGKINILERISEGNTGGGLGGVVYTSRDV